MLFDLPDHATAATQIQNPPARPGPDKMGQEHRIHGKTVAVPGLEEQEVAAKKPVLTDFSRGCRRDLCRLDAGTHGGHHPGRHGEKCKKQTRQFMANMFTIERIPGASPATAQREECVDIFIESQFSGGHHLRAYPGNCERPHGHNWKVRVTVRAQKLDRLGMAIKIILKTNRIYYNLIKMLIPDSEQRGQTLLFSAAPARKTEKPQAVDHIEDRKSVV